jgi:phosphoserine phosphatase
MDQLAYAAGIGDQVAAITARCMAGELDFQQSFRQRLGLLAGFSTTGLETIYNSIELMPGAERLMRNLVARGVHCVILSGGFSYFANRFAQRLGMQEAYSNPLEQCEDRLTGSISVRILDAERKLELLQQLTRQQGLQPWQTIAVGDGANDLPMLLGAGLGVAFHAKPLVQQQAQHRISQFGLDTLLYVMGYGDDELLD